MHSLYPATRSDYDGEVMKRELLNVLRRMPAEDRPLPDAIYNSAAAKIREKYMEEHGGYGMVAANLPLGIWLREWQKEHIDAVFCIEACLKAIEAGNIREGE